MREINLHARLRPMKCCRLPEAKSTERAAQGAGLSVIALIPAAAEAVPDKELRT